MGLYGVKVKGEKRRRGYMGLYGVKVKGRKGGGVIWGYMG